jgi:Collagen triple helix repeat (20 copies)/Head domain of trimeric autotransporter adhesin
MKQKFLLFAVLLMGLSSISKAQNNVGVNTTTPHPSAALDVQSTSQGMLVPRMTAAQRDSISLPATGLLVYQSDMPAGFYYFNGTVWSLLGATGANGVNGTNGTNGTDGVSGTNGIDGINGTNGIDGAKGLDGKSAYELAVDAGYTGTEAAWLLSLQGVNGSNGTNGTDGFSGTNGINGINGTNGLDGAKGLDGKSAYELAVDAGYTGTEAAWLLSLQGTNGSNGTDGWNGMNGSDGVNGTDGLNGLNGLSAYQEAVSLGFVGSDTAWLLSLHGTNGVNGQGIAQGGTAGQVLAKIDATDFNTQWITPAAAGGGASQLEKITEGGNTGWRILGRDTAKHGKIGIAAIDFSYSDTLSNIYGATGAYSTAFGYNTESYGITSFATGLRSNASGFASVAMGEKTTAQSERSVALGYNSTALGLSSRAFGVTCFSQADSSTAIGNYTTTQGRGAVAIGNYLNAQGNDATALGNYSSAQGQNATVLGTSNSASGPYSTAFGTSDTASGLFSTAMGISTIASAYGATALGDQCKATNKDAIAGGFKSLASGFASTAFGSGGQATGTSAVALGKATEASGENSMAIGEQTIALAQNSLAVGFRTKTKSYGETAIGSFNDTLTTSDMTAFAGDYNRVFTVGIGTSSSARKTALVVQQDGNVGIGDRTPSSLLDVDGSMSLPIIVTSSSFFTPNATHHTIIFTASTNIALPGASFSKGRIYKLVNSSTSAASITYINYAGVTVYTFPAATALTVQSDGTNWRQIP